MLGSRTAAAASQDLDTSPHNIPFVALGTALLWFGWFGFNGDTTSFQNNTDCSETHDYAGGSALASGSTAAFAAVNSEISASTSMVVWTIVDWVRYGKPTLVGLCVGAIAGLATITPLAGFIKPWAALVVGILGSLGCYLACELKKLMKWDDALDVWGVHGKQ